MPWFRYQISMLFISFHFLKAIKWVNNTVKERQIAVSKLKNKLKRDVREESNGGSGRGGSGPGPDGAGRSMLLPDPIDATFTISPPVSNSCTPLHVHLL